MSEQSKCPKCGAEVRQDHGLFRKYECGSILMMQDSGAGPKGAFTRSDMCRERMHLESQLAQSQAENARLKNDIITLEAANWRWNEALTLIWDEHKAGDFEISSMAEALIMNALHTSPSTWLAAHDAEVKREAVKEFRDLTNSLNNRKEQPREMSSFGKKLLAALEADK